MKFIIYCRKSTESEERQVLSIESQENELLDFAKKNELTVVETLKESQSAKAPGRHIFEKLLATAEKSKGIGLLVWKLDRLARNALDGGKISWFMDRGLITEIRTPEKTFHNTADDKFMMSLDFGMAKKYIDDLSQNVKRGNKTKLEKGGWPGVAPFGYLNDKGNKTVYPDPERAHYVELAYELYGSGKYGLNEVVQILYTRGLRTHNGKKYHKNQLHRMLSNPFYTGVMLRVGKLYQGAHEPVISKDLFDRVQQVRDNRLRPRMKTRFFALRGFMTCDDCGCAITATQKKGHNYYYCTNGKNKCQEHKQYLREEKLSVKIADKILAKLQFNPEIVDIMYHAAKEKLQHGNYYQELSIQNLENQLQKLAQKRDKLLDSYLGELVPEEAYTAKIGILNGEEVALKNQLSILRQKKDKGDATLEQTKKVFLSANSARNDFLDADEYKKRNVLSKLLWNLTLREQEIASFQLKSPYELFLKTPNLHLVSHWQGIVEDVRTILQRQTGYIHIPNLREG